MLKASGIWVSPGRGRGPAAGPPGGGAGRGGGGAGHRGAGEAGRLRDPGSRPGGHRGRADRVLPPGAAVVQAAAQGGVRGRLPDHGHREDPPGRAAPDGRHGAGPPGARGWGNRARGNRARERPCCRGRAADARRTPARRCAPASAPAAHAEALVAGVGARLRRPRGAGPGLRRRGHHRARPSSPPTWPPTAWTSPCCSASTAPRPPASSRSRTCCRSRRTARTGSRSSPTSTRTCTTRWTRNSSASWPGRGRAQDPPGARRGGGQRPGAVPGVRDLPVGRDPGRGALRDQLVPRVDQRPGRPGAAGRRAARLPPPRRRAGPRRPRLVVRRGRVPGPVQRACVDRAVRPAAVTVAATTTPSTTGTGSPGG